MEAEKNIVDKVAHKKRLKSMNHTLQSLQSQIEENHGILHKELKKRMKNDPKPEIVQTVEDLNKEVELSELKRRLREQAAEAGRRRKEEEGKFNFSLAISA